MSESLMIFFLFTNHLHVVVDFFIEILFYID